jgi:hypothetical protein
MLGSTNATFASVVNGLMGYIYALEWLLSGAALLIFIWGVVKFMGGSKSQTDGYKFMTWGIVGLFVILSLSGLIFFLRDSLIGDTYTPRCQVGAPC